MTRRLVLPLVLVFVAALLALTIWLGGNVTNNYSASLPTPKALGQTSSASERDGQASDRQPIDSNSQPAPSPISLPSSDQEITSANTLASPTTDVQSCAARVRHAYSSYQQTISKSPALQYRAAEILLGLCVANELTRQGRGVPYINEAKRTYPKPDVHYLLANGRYFEFPESEFPVYDTVFKQARELSDLDEKAVMEPFPPELASQIDGIVGTTLSNLKSED